MGILCERSFSTFVKRLIGKLENWVLGQMKLHFYGQLNCPFFLWVGSSSKNVSNKNDQIKLNGKT